MKQRNLSKSLISLHSQYYVIYSFRIPETLIYTFQNVYINIQFYIKKRQENNYKFDNIKKIEKEWKLRAMKMMKI